MKAFLVVTNPSHAISDDVVGDPDILVGVFKVIEVDPQCGYMVGFGAPD